jgi:hypothetical protein
MIALCTLDEAGMVMLMVTFDPGAPVRLAVTFDKL